MSVIHDNVKRLVIRDLGENPECGICMTEMNKENITVFECCHVVCSDCAPRMRKKECPFCRHKFMTNARSMSRAMEAQLRAEIENSRTIILERMNEISANRQVIDESRYRIQRLQEENYQFRRIMESFNNIARRATETEYVPSDPTDMMFGLTENAPEPETETITIPTENAPEPETESIAETPALDTIRRELFPEYQSDTESIAETPETTPATPSQRVPQRWATNSRCGRCGELGHYSHNRRLCAMHPSRN